MEGSAAKMKLFGYESPDIFKKLTEVFDQLDVEALQHLQNNIMKTINSRYGDYIEANLREDPNFHHLFKSENKIQDRFQHFFENKLLDRKKVFNVPKKSTKYKIVQQIRTKKMVEKINLEKRTKRQYIKKKLTTDMHQKISGSDQKENYRKKSSERCRRTEVFSNFDRSLEINPKLKKRIPLILQKKVDSSHINAQNTIAENSNVVVLANHPYIENPYIFRETSNQAEFWKHGNESKGIQKHSVYISKGECSINRNDGGSKVFIQKLPIRNLPGSEEEIFTEVLKWDRKVLQTKLESNVDDKRSIDGKASEEDDIKKIVEANVGKNETEYIVLNKEGVKMKSNKKICLEKTTKVIEKDDAYKNFSNEKFVEFITTVVNEEIQDTAASSGIKNEKIALENNEKHRSDEDNVQTKKLLVGEKLLHSENMSTNNYCGEQDRENSLFDKHLENCMLNRKRDLQEVEKYSNIVHSKSVENKFCLDNTQISEESSEINVECAEIEISLQGNFGTANASSENVQKLSPIQCKLDFQKIDSPNDSENLSDIEEINISRNEEVRVHVEDKFPVDKMSEWVVNYPESNVTQTSDEDDENILLKVTYKKDDLEQIFMEKKNNDDIKGVRCSSETKIYGKNVKERAREKKIWQSLDKKIFYNLRSNDAKIRKRTRREFGSTEIITRSRKNLMPLFSKV